MLGRAKDVRPYMVGEEDVGVPLVVIRIHWQLELYDYCRTDTALPGGTDGPISWILLEQNALANVSCRSNHDSILLNL